MRYSSIKNYTSWISASYDMSAVIIAWFIACFFVSPSMAVSRWLVQIPSLLIIYSLVFLWLKPYRQIWRYTSIDSLVKIIKATFIGLLLFAAKLLLIRPHTIVLRSIILFPGFLILGMAWPRLASRYYLAKTKDKQQAIVTLLIGAGHVAELFIRDAKRTQLYQYNIIGVLDDAPLLRGKELHGIQIIGSIADLHKKIIELKPELVISAIPSLRGIKLREIKTILDANSIPLRSVPSMSAIADGKVSVSSLREISIEDILGREPVSLDSTIVEKSLGQQTVLVTGGGGSIGSEICRQLALLPGIKLVIADHSEFNLYNISKELEHAAVTVYSHLVDVKDARQVDYLFQKYRPNIVFHAAAYKHVPLLEHQICQAVSNNSLGTQQVALAAQKYAVDKFILISTDKAVNPTNFMGASKRLAEIFCGALDKTSMSTRFIAVRFGNVLGSSGSVLPLFKKQLADGGPLTVTHPDVVRFFMTIPEACELVLQTVALGTGGEIFVLDMGQPVKISYLAEQLIRLSGKIPHEDIQIEYIGLRPGEKLYEELVGSKEQLHSTGCEKINRVDTELFHWDIVKQLFDELAQAVEHFDELTLMHLVQKLVPINKAIEQKSVGQLTNSSDAVAHKEIVANLQPAT